ncbi:hypothetical protein V6N13_090665 [Hibiscus sabdariffa]|uniref:Uncharacterized protein n=1 Tax=Hibiscus sabdariffa TaxID=183260 RepID=A0ABR2NX97_9ROSI
MAEQQQQQIPILKLGTQGPEKQSLFPLMLQTELKRGGTKLAVRNKLYKSIIQKAKEILHSKTVKTGLTNKIEEKRVMVESLMASKREAAESVASLELLQMRRDELIDQLNSGIDGFQRLRALETLLMLELGLI